MDLANLRTFLLYCTAINFGILALWGVLTLLPHDWMRNLWTRRITAEQFEAINFAGILLYEILFFIFNVVPYVALLMLG